MYQKILVPLDGSELAECVLPHVEAMAGGCKVKDVVLVRVVEPFRERAASDYAMRPEDMDRIDAQSIAEADSYLKQVQAKTKMDGTRVQNAIPPQECRPPEGENGCFSSAGKAVHVIQRRKENLN